MFQRIINFFTSLFSPESPDGKKRLELKKLEMQLKNIPFAVYKNGSVLPAFADMMFILCRCSDTLRPLLTATVRSEDPRTALKYTDFLIFTGFSQETADIYQSLSAPERKTRLAAASDVIKEKDTQRRQFELVVKSLNSGEFKVIDGVLEKLDRLADICDFNYTALLRHFDSSFSSDASYEPHFSAAPLLELTAGLMDFYYIAAGFEMTLPVANALAALAEQFSGQLSAQKYEELMDCSKRVASVIRRNKPCQIVELLLRLGKKDEHFVPESERPEKQFVENYRERIQNLFAADGQRIDLELQDEKLREDIHSLFGSQPLLTVEGYNAEMNEFLQTNTPHSLIWITPMQIMKTFFPLYFGEQVRNLLDTVLVEGFFVHQSFQSSFAALVYRCEETANSIAEFEKSFDSGGRNSWNLIKGYIKDSQKGNDFRKKLSDMIDLINLQAKKLVQEETGAFFQLKSHVRDMTEDSKKVSPEYVTNIRVIINSAKNRENFEFIETHFTQWEKFIEIMRNYAIIGSSSTTDNTL